jgi:hypothetical protein
MSTLSKFTDHQLASMLDSLQEGIPGKRSDLIAEVAYRLFRAGGGPLDARQAELLDIIATRCFRARIERREQRRNGKQLAGGGKAFASEEAARARCRYWRFRKRLKANR